MGGKRRRRGWRGRVTDMLNEPTGNSGPPATHGGDLSGSSPADGQPRRSTLEWSLEHAGALAALAGAIGFVLYAIVIAFAAAFYSDLGTSIGAVGIDQRQV